MQPDPYMALFTVISFTSLGFGAVILSLVTLMATGSRLWSVILAISTLLAGAYIWFEIDPLGMFPTGLGLVALLIALKKPRRQSNG
ncbi:MAG: hypothetical protein RIS82_509 [Actinomycetota bacterium]